MPSLGNVAAELQVVVGVDTRALDTGLQQASQKVSAFGQGLSSVFAGIGAGIGMKAFDAITSGFSAAGDAAIGFNAKLEQSTIAFTSMLGSGEKAQAFLDDMKAFAAATPFEFNDLLDASRKMLAFGFAAKDVKPLLSAVGNAASAMGAGQSGIDRITNALGQMKAATVVQKGELNQLTEIGVPAYDILAKAVGKSTQETMKMVEQGKIASDVFIKAFQEWTKANFGDMMAKQALTFDGAMATIKDSLQFATAEAAKPFFDAISAGAVQLATFVQSDTFASWARGLAATLQEAFRQIADAWRTVQQVFAGEWEPSEAIAPFVNAVGTIALAIRDTVMPAVTALIGLIQQAVSAMGGATPIISGLAAAFGALVVIGTAIALIGGLTAAIAAITSPIGLVVTAIGLLVAAWQGNWMNIVGVTTLALEQMAPVFQALVDWLGSKIPPVLEWISSTGWPALVAAGQQVSEWITGTAVPALTALAEALGPKMQTVVDWLSGTGWPGLVTAGTAVGAMVVSVTGFLAALFAELEKRQVFADVALLMEDVGRVAQKLAPLITAVTGAIAGVLATQVQMIAYLTGIHEKAGPAATAITAIGAAFSGWVNILRSQISVIERVVDALNNLINAFSRARSAASSAGSWKSVVGGSNFYAKGGVIGEPVVGMGMRSGESYVFGEAGPEAVVPLSGVGPLPSMVGAGGAGQTVYQSVTLNVYGHAIATKRELADLVVQALREAQDDGRTRMRLV